MLHEKTIVEEISGKNHSNNTFSFHNNHFIINDEAADLNNNKYKMLYLMNYLHSDCPVLIYAALYFFYIVLPSLFRGSFTFFNLLIFSMAGPQPQSARRIQQELNQTENIICETYKMQFL